LRLRAGLGADRLTRLDDGCTARDRERLVEDLRPACGGRVDVPEIVGALAAAGDDTDDRTRVFAEGWAARVALTNRATALELVGTERRLALRDALAHRQDRHVVLAEARADRQALVVLAISNRPNCLTLGNTSTEADRDGLDVRDGVVEDDERDVSVAKEFALR